MPIQGRGHPPRDLIEMAADQQIDARVIAALGDRCQLPANSLQNEDLALNRGELIAQAFQGAG